jgi:hypothetical protein
MQDNLTVEAIAPLINEITDGVTDENTSVEVPKNKKAKKASFKEALMITNAITQLTAHLSKIDKRVKKLRVASKNKLKNNNIKPKVPEVVTKVVPQVSPQTFSMIRS